MQQTRPQIEFNCIQMLPIHKLFQCCRQTKKPGWPMWHNRVSLIRGEWESNPRVTDLQSVALATWLSPQTPGLLKFLNRQFKQTLPLAVRSGFIPNVSAEGLRCCTEILSNLRGKFRTWNTHLEFWQNYPFSSLLFAKENPLNLRTFGISDGSGAQRWHTGISTRRMACSPDCCGLQISVVNLLQKDPDS